MSILLDGTAGEQLSGNLTFTGTGQRITGDFSNATQSSRVTFQTSTTNGITGLEVIPNGTATSSLMTFSNTNDATNAGTIQVYVDNAASIINSNKRGTGTYLPLQFYTSATPQMTIATDGTITGTKGNLQLISGTAVASTSGTSITFTGIPSWAKRITVMLNGVSNNAGSQFLVQVGSGSVTTSGYVSTSVNSTSTNAVGASTSTAGFIIASGTAAENTNGHMVLTLVSGNIWISSHAMARNTGWGLNGGGSVTLSGTLDRVVLTTVNGTDTFDAGSINIMYE